MSCPWLNYEPHCSAGGYLLEIKRFKPELYIEDENLPF